MSEEMIPSLLDSYRDRYLSSDFLIVSSARAFSSAMAVWLAKLVTAGTSASVRPVPAMSNTPCVSPPTINRAAMPCSILSKAANRLTSGQSGSGKPSAMASAILFPLVKKACPSARIRWYKPPDTSGMREPWTESPINFAATWRKVASKVR